MGISYKMISVKSFCKKDYGYNVNDFIDAKLITMTKDEALMLLKEFCIGEGYSNVITDESAKKLIDIIDDTDLLLTCAYNHDFKPTTIALLDNVLADDVFVSFSSNDNRKLNELLSNALKDEDDINITFIQGILKHVKNPETIFNVLFEKVSNTKKLVGYIEDILEPFAGMEGPEARVIAPYLLNQEKYMFFINKIEDLKSIELHVMATKNKEIIAYYIYKSGRYDLIYDLFKNEDIYLMFCKEVFDEEIVQKIESFMRNGGRYKFVDNNIEEYLGKFNEPINIKFYS